MSLHTQLCDRVCACVCTLSSSILSFPFSSSFFFFVIRALLLWSFRSRNMCAAAAAPTRVISSLCDDALVFLVHSVSPLTKRTERQDIHVARLAALAIDWYQLLNGTTLLYTIIIVYILFITLAGIFSFTNWRKLKKGLKHFDHFFFPPFYFFLVFICFYVERDAQMWGFGACGTRANTDPNENRFK